MDWKRTSITHNSRQSEVTRDHMASVATFCVPSKRLFLLVTVNQAPSLALRMSNMVSFHKEHSSYNSKVMLDSVNPQGKTVCRF